MSRIAPILLDWYNREGRDLPWRQTRDAYLIWLSEVILQQTRVAQGLAYYERFAARFPHVEALAAASEDEVLKLWQGLGYYSRARNLHAAAQQVVHDMGGIFPTDPNILRSLRGVGDYTAAAIASASADIPCAVVDGNVYRLLSRIFDLDLPIDSTAGKRRFAALAQSELDPAHAGRYNQAIMDFGALQCTPSTPRCEECPLAQQCLALAAGTVAERPVKRGRTLIRDRWFSYLHIVRNNQTLLHRRGEGDIWQGLYEFPLIESQHAVDFSQIIATPLFKELFAEAHWQLLHTTHLPRHQLSHQRLHATCYLIDTDRWSPPAEMLVVASTEIDNYALPRLIDRYLESL